MLLALAAVTFTLASSSAKAVQFASDFKGWSAPEAMRATKGTWRLLEPFPDDARIEYKFVVDGNWILDPGNPNRIDNGVGGENSFWEGPRYRKTEFDHEPRRSMTARAMTVNGYAVRIFEPPTLRDDMPILIYGDGKGYEDRLHAPIILENLIEAGKVKPAVLVLVEPIDRNRDYMTSPKPYEDFVAGPLIEAVRGAEPKASKSARDVFVGGASLGGYIALKLVEDYPSKIAGGVHSQSGAFQVGRQTMDPGALMKIPAKAKLFLDWGAYEQELTSVNVDLAGRLKGINRSFGQATTHEGHNWTAWRHRFADGLRFLLGR